MPRDQLQPYSRISTQQLPPPQGITSSVNSEMPNINILITQLQGVMREAQSVLEGLKNNPLIKNGVSGKVENDSSSPKLREDNF